MTANGISTILDDDDAEFIFELLSEDGGDDPQEWKSRVKLVRSYQEGKIGSCSGGWLQSPITRTCRGNRLVHSPKRV